MKVRHCLNLSSLHLTSVSQQFESILPFMKLPLPTSGLIALPLPKGWHHLQLPWFCRKEAATQTIQSFQNTSFGCVPPPQPWPPGFFVFVTKKIPVEPTVTVPLQEAWFGSARCFSIKETIASCPSCADSPKKSGPKAWHSNNKCHVHIYIYMYRIYIYIHDIYMCVYMVKICQNQKIGIHRSLPLTFDSRQAGIGWIHVGPTIDV